MADADQTPLPLPVTSLTRLAPGVILSQPLSRKGSGPGLIVLVNQSGATNDTTLRIENGVPSPLMKWGEESYTVVELLEEAFFEGKDPISLAVSELSKAERCEPKNAIGVIGMLPQSLSAHCIANSDDSVRFEALEPRSTISNITLLNRRRRRLRKCSRAPQARHNLRPSPATHGGQDAQAASDRNSCRPRLPQCEVPPLCNALSVGI